MIKRFLLIAGALIVLSLISAGIGNSRTVTITPRDTQNTPEVQTTFPPETEPAQTAAVQEVSLTYVLNVNTKKFHRPDCASVTQMKEKNRLPVNSTREEVISQGYEPCQNCDP